MKKLIWIIAVLISVTLNGCITEKVSVKEPQDKYIIYNIKSFPEDLLMLKISDRSHRDFSSYLFEGLISIDEEGNIVPALADSWEISKDGITYTFNIREDARWSDGSDITAKDFVDFFSHILSPSVENEFAYQLSSIYGVINYRKGSSSFRDVAITAPEERMLQIRLNTEYPDLLKILSQPLYGLRGDKNSLKDWRRSYKSIKFSGPFAIKDVLEGNKVILSKNSYYWNEVSINNNEFMLSGNNNPEASLAELESSKVNIMSEPPLSELKRLTEAAKEEDTMLIYTKRVIGVAFNFKGAPILRDANFRKAINEVLDPMEIADAAFPEFNMHIDAESFSETRNVFKDNAFKGNKDNNKGMSYLEKAGSIKQITLRLVGINKDKNRRLAKAVSESIKNTLKINVQTKLYSAAELEDIVKKGEFDLIINEYEQSYDSKLAWLERWVSSSKENVGRYSNPDFENSLFKAKFDTDKSKRRKGIEECEAILKDELPVIPLFHDVDVIVKKEYIKGLRVTPNGNLDIGSIYRDNSILNN